MEIHFWKVTDVVVLEIKEKKLTLKNYVINYDQCDAALNHLFEILIGTVYSLQVSGKQELWTKKQQNVDTYPNIHKIHVSQLAVTTEYLPI